MNEPVAYRPQLSIVLPVYNEVDNLQSLHEQLTSVLRRHRYSYEIVYCNDGSTDGSGELLKQIASGDPRVVVVSLKRNFGQTAAIAAGIDHTRGEIVVMSDADLQNDPADIPKLVEKIQQGYDIASGWRKQRNDPWLTKKIPSYLANRLISWITGVHIHDHGCTLKAYKRDVLETISLYGEMHRFITILGHWAGARIVEVEVRHHPRTAGKSKYSLTRIAKVLLDLPLLVLLGSYLTKPIHFFGGIGLGFNFIAFLCVVDVAYEKFIEGDKASNNPFLLLAVFFSIVGIQIVIVGLLAELITRVYYESQQKKIYAIDEIIQSNERSNGDEA